MIAASHRLPFHVAYTPDVLSDGRDASLHIQMAQAGGGDAVTAAVARFARIARHGALGGASIPPAASTITWRREPAASPLELSWKLERPHVATEALSVLANLLLYAHATEAISTVQVRIDGDASPLALLASGPPAEATFPGMHAPSFVLDDDGLQADAFDWRVELQSAPSADDVSRLNEMTSDWASAVTGGAWSTEPLRPQDAWIEADEHVMVAGSTIEWAFFKLRADEACIDALINAWIAFHGRHVPVSTLTLR